jgi:hypothetical protein
LPNDVDRDWVDDDLARAARAVLVGDCQPALDLLAVSRGDVQRRELYAGVLGAVGQRRRADLREMVEVDDGDADRWLLLGSALIAAAWTARGADVADRMTPDQVDGLVELSGQARTALRRAVKLDPDDAVPWSVLMRCALGAPEEPEEVGRAFARATRLAPQLFGAHCSRLTSLTRKWYGSMPEAFAFARERTADLPPGHPLHALIALAHIEGWVDGAMRGNVVGRVWRTMRYFKNAGVRAEVDAASDRLLAGADDFTDHGSSMSAHQMFAALYHEAEDPMRLRPHLERGGPGPTTWPWGYFGDHIEVYAAARTAAGLASG